MNFVVNVKVASAGPGKITMLHRLSAVLVMCVSGAWAFEFVSPWAPAVLNSTFRHGLACGLCSTVQLRR